MANALYSAYKQVVLGDPAVSGFTAPSLETSDLRMILLDSANYTANLTTNQDLVDIPAIARVAVVALTGKSLLLSNNLITLSADNGTFGTVSGDQAELIAVYSHTGVESTSLLIIKFDTFGSGMPVTPNGGNINVDWNDSGLFTW